MNTPFDDLQTRDERMKEFDLDLLRYKGWLLMVLLFTFLAGFLAGYWQAK